MGIELEIKNLDRLKAKMDQFPAIAEKHINRAIARALNRIFGEEKLQAPVDTAMLRDNWKVDIGRFEGSFRSNAPYALAVHNGTRPHPVAAKSLEAWARKRGLNPWAVAKSIAKNGTKANPFLKRAVDLQKDNVNKEFATALENITAEIALK